MVFPYLHTSYQLNDDGHVCMHNCGIWLVDIQSRVVNRYSYMSSIRYGYRNSKLGVGEIYFGSRKLYTKQASRSVISTYIFVYTGTPKGVMPSYETLLHNFQLMEKIMKTDRSMVEISFLPHFHAMGLVVSYLQILYHGGTGYFMSPVTFIENPGIWMKAFSLFHGTHAKAPNFAFELVLKKGFPKSIDLSSACYIVSGSEPVCIETVKEFESTLAPYGLKKNTVRVGYGLAEHMAYLCGVCDHEDPVIVDRQISCGMPIPDTSMTGMHVVTGGRD